jgi:ParB-like chromosome segregation protein Spo0J
VSLLPVSDIDTGERFRKDMGDLPGLAASIDAVGLLHPIVVMGQPNTSRWLLVAGERRLRACRDLLHWERIHVRIVPGTIDLLRAERDENEVREPFTPSEAVAIAAALRPVEKAAAAERQQATRFGSDGSATVAAPAESRERIAAAVGMSHTTLAKATEVVEAAAENPVLAPLVEAMDDTGRVAPVHAALQALPPDPEPEQVEAAAESVRVRRAAERALSEDPEVQEKARAARFARAMARHSEAQYALAAEHWTDGLDRSDINAMRNHVVVARRWVEDWERELSEAPGLRVIGGTK